MGRRGGQLLRGTPALPAAGPRAAVRGPSGGLRPWAGSVSGRGSGARFPGNARETARVRGLAARRRVFLLATRACPRPVSTAAGCCRSLSAREAGVCGSGPGALAPGV